MDPQLGIAPAPADAHQPIPTADPLAGLVVCWFGGMRQRQPLDSTQAKKWALLVSMGLRPLVIGFSADARYRHFTQDAEFFLLPSLPAAPLRYATLLLLGGALLLWLTLRRGVRAIVTQSPHDGAAGAAVKQIARWAGWRVALVIESHGDFEVSVFAQRRIRAAGLYRTLMAALARYALRRADRLRAVSNSTQAQLARWAPGKPIDQFLAWTDLSAFARAARPAPPSACQDIVCAAVLIPRKNIHLLIEAFAAIAPEQPTAKLRLFGTPENRSYADELRAQVERLGVGERVQFAGAVPQAELAAALARAKALALVSSSEGLPRAVVEAMVNGLPVIGTAVSGIPDLIRDGETGYLIPPGDAPALTAALRRLYADPALDALAERARAFALARFSETGFADGYRRLLTAALEAVR